jgi:predicted nucleic acid-binding protein
MATKKSQSLSPSIGKSFIDSNVVLYLLSADAKKADQAEAAMNDDVTISVQVLNEIVSVARRKIDMPWKDLTAFLSLVKSICVVQPLTLGVHENGCRLAERYGFSVYDAMIVAAAREAECATLFSEDMQHGLVVDDCLQICNPFL